MYLGIDTSAYTTSLAVVDESSKVVLDLRKVLNVELGKRGLRQSEAVFQHLKNIEALASKIKPFNLKAIAVSTKPRSKNESYMPVFKVGHATASLLANTIGVPLYEYSHQEGHLAAGLWSTDSTLIDEDILAIHISGGTSDVLDLTGSFIGMNIIDLGCSSDLHAGQYVDRVGVMLGADFPAGKTMNKWANECFELSERLPSHAKKYSMSFSGPEAAANRFIKEGLPKEKVSKAVFVSIARTLEKVIRYSYSKKKYHKVLIVGGVACNTIIKDELYRRLPYEINFCDSKYSSDNAVGTALLALKKFKQEEV